MLYTSLQEKVKHALILTGHNSNFKCDIMPPESLATLYKLLN